MLLTPLFKDLDMPTKVSRYQGWNFTSPQEQFWPDALPATTSDSYGYHWELKLAGCKSGIL